MRSDLLVYLQIAGVFLGKKKILNSDAQVDGILFFFCEKLLFWNKEDFLI